jgi:hypothetical protein
LREEKTGGKEFSCGVTKVWEGLNGMSTGPDMLLSFREDRTTGAQLLENGLRLRLGVVGLRWT